MTKLLYQGHGSMRLTLDDGMVIYIDPYAGEGYEQPADLILVSHHHYDHDVVDKPAKKPDCQILSNRELLVAGKYLPTQVKSLRIEPVPAYNKNHAREESIGFLLVADSHTLYFSGDTSAIPEMANLIEREIEYAFFCTDGEYNMGVEEAMECANLIGAAHNTPIHTSPESDYDPAVAQRFTALNTLLMTPGEEIVL